MVLTRGALNTAMCYENIALALFVQVHQWIYACGEVAGVEKWQCSHGSPSLTVSPTTYLPFFSPSSFLPWVLLCYVQTVCHVGFLGRLYAMVSVHSVQVLVYPVPRWTVLVFRLRGIPSESGMLAGVKVGNRAFVLNPRMEERQRNVRHFSCLKRLKKRGVEDLSEGIIRKLGSGLSSCH